MTNKPPAFMFYPKDFLVDEKVRLLDHSQIGWYIILMCHCWLEGSVPADSRAAMRLVGGISAENEGRLQEVLLLCFEPSKSDSKRLTQPRLDLERKRQRNNSESMRNNAKARWDKRLSHDASAVRRQSNGNALHLHLPLHLHSKTKQPPLPPFGGFDEFWKVYPRKVSKGQAEKAWIKIKPDNELQTKILAAVEAAKSSRQWLKDNGEFIPYPATWLNAKGWEDDHSAPPQPTKPVAGPPKLRVCPRCPGQKEVLETEWLMHQSQHGRDPVDPNASKLISGLADKLTPKKAAS